MDNSRNSISFYKYKNVPSIEIRKSQEIQPCITIGIPTFKRCDLESALQSAIKQIDFDLPYEIIVLDNNPERNDDTELYIKDLNTSILSYYKNEKNIGLTGNWNRLFELCRTEYLVLLHDDDILSPYYLYNIWPIVQHYAPGLIKTKQYIWNENKEAKPEFMRYTPSLDCTEAKAEMVLLKFQDWMLSGVVIRKKTLIELGGFDEKYYPSGDYKFFSDMLGFCQILFVDKFLFTYRFANNLTLKLKTQIEWLKVDNVVREEIGRKTNFPQWLLQYIYKGKYAMRVNDIFTNFSSEEVHAACPNLKKSNSLNILFFRLFSKFYNFIIGYTY